MYVFAFAYLMVFLAVSLMEIFSGTNASSSTLLKTYQCVQVVAWQTALWFAISLDAIIIPSSYRKFVGLLQFFAISGCVALYIANYFSDYDVPASSFEILGYTFSTQDVRQPCLLNTVVFLIRNFYLFIRFPCQLVTLQGSISIKAMDAVDITNRGRRHSLNDQMVMDRFVAHTSSVAEKEAARSKRLAALIDSVIEYEASATGELPIVSMEHALSIVSVRRLTDDNMRQSATVVGEVPSSLDEEKRLDPLLQFASGNVYFPVPEVHT
jgi:hypothetical protein